MQITIRSNLNKWK